HLLAGGAVSVTQRAFDGLVKVLTSAAGTATTGVGRLGAAPPDDRPDVLLTPLSLTRVGRSRRLGALLDLELAVAVEAAGDDVLDLTERLLAAAESAPGVRVGPLPEPAAGFGFVAVLAVSVPVAEPTGPPVEESVVEVHSLAAVTGVVVGPDGAALPDVEVHSSLTRQRATTDAAGRFSLPGLPRPTTLTVSRGPRRTTLEVPDEPDGLRIVLPSHEGS
ncbi:MAG: carboxypeptidase-like regulatory domain-containing protein, partial [Propionicimonas sp.]|nr:carboxypeptidase-like regulatory domain-containing protein [Propionicimonas sp.]